MTIDDIAKVLSALDGIPVETVRAIIERADKLRELVFATTPQEAPKAPAIAPAAKPPTWAEDPESKATSSKEAIASTAKGAITHDVIKYLQSHGRSRIIDIARGTGREYQQVNGALQTLRKGGRATKDEGWHALTDTTLALPPKGRPAKTPKLPPEHPPLPPPIEPRKRTIPSAPFITKHVRERWAEHHDDVSNEAILTSYTHGIELDAGIAAQVTNVARRGAGDSTYRLSPDRRGIFVVSSNLGSKALVTYLRLTEKHVEWFLENYPVTGQSATAH